METPTNVRTPTQRIHTPRIVERRKSLFIDNPNEKLINFSKEKDIEHIQQDSLDGIRPLTPEPIKSYQEDAFNNSIKSMLKKCPPKTISLLYNNQSLDVNMFSKLSKSPKQMPTKPILQTQFTNNNESCDIEQSPSTKSTSYCAINKRSSPFNVITSPITPINKRNCTDELGILFNSSMNLKNEKKKPPPKDIQYDESANLSFTDEEVSRDVPSTHTSTAQKRIHFKTDEKSPPMKFAKTTLQSTIHSLTDVPIPTRSFYSNKENTSVIKYTPSINILATLNPTNYNKKKIKSQKIEKKIFNRGVTHKIRRKPHPAKKQSIDEILKDVNDKFKLLPSQRLSPKKIEVVHQILASNSNPINIAKPLNIVVAQEISCNFSDIENDTDSDDNDDDDDSILPASKRSKLDINSLTGEEDNRDSMSNMRPTNKIFKSGKNSTTRKEISITDNIKGTILNGKISLKAKKLKRKKALPKSSDKSFSMEQATVDDIIKTLDTNLYPNELNSEIESQSKKTIMDELTKEIDIIRLLRNRLPYNTTDPQQIEQQYLLLDFLITNQICTEKNFNIFIGDPDNHREEADRICNDLVCIVNHNMNGQFDYADDDDRNNKFRNMLPYKTDEPAKIEQQHLLLDFLIENHICTDKTFKIFISEPDNYKQEAKEIVDRLVRRSAEQSDNLDVQTENTTKVVQKVENMETETCQNKETNGAALFPIFYPGKCQPITKKPPKKITRHFKRGSIGLNQYQIDAGQKEYGAKQCNQCGLIYTVHEPEEEKLHLAYHNSLHVLKFRSWIDEDVIAVFPEWGDDGRIIRLASSCQSKKKERLMDVLRIVDQELGFSSYILPSKFVAFFAVRKFQIVGFCLVQFLDSANKYVYVDGLDCCTEETFEVKCGISRIWVSPFHRRLHIASKLILAVKNHTFLDETIGIDQIAFSAPTEAGKLFAQSITKREDFLVYQ